MWSMEIGKKALADAQSAGKLLGVSVQPHPDIETDDWLFEMLLRLARRVDSLERQKPSSEQQALDELTAQAQEDGDY